MAIAAVTAANLFNGLNTYAWTGWVFFAVAVGPVLVWAYTVSPHKSARSCGTDCVFTRPFTPRSRLVGSPPRSTGMIITFGDRHTSGSGSCSLWFSRCFPASCGRRTCTFSVRQIWTRSDTFTSTSLTTTSLKIGQAGPSQCDLPSSASQPVLAVRTAMSLQRVAGQTCPPAYSHRIVGSTSPQKRMAALPYSGYRPTCPSSRAGIACRSAGHDGPELSCPPSRCPDLFGGRNSPHRVCER